MDQLAFDFGTVVPRDVPLADVEWGTWGTLTARGHGGSLIVVSGYGVKTARIYTGGYGEKNTGRGTPLLNVSVFEPPERPEWGGSCVGFYADMDAVFRAATPPADRPLTYPRCLGRRMPGADLRRGDTFYQWRLGGRGTEPRMHVQADPVPVDGHLVDVVVWADGRLQALRLDAYTWVDVVDPTEESWQAAPADLRPGPGR